MPVHSIETMNAILDGWLGPNRAAGAPASYEVEGWIDDPRQVGAQEADFGGYTPAVWSSANWGPAEGGRKDATALVSLGTPTSAGTDAVRFWALRNVTSGELAFSAPLERPVYIGAASANPVQIRPTVKFAD
jgi:hypothetical protein